MNEDSLPSTLADIMCTAGTLASGDRILSVKSSIDGIGWNEQYQERLEGFVNIIHPTKTHAYSMSQFIFLCGLQGDPNSDITAYINKEFFSEVSLSSVRYRCNRVGDAAARRRTWIGQCIQKYLMIHHFAPNTRYQKSVRGVGFRRAVEKHGFLVYWMDEFRTSQCCPSCEHQSQIVFKRILNPRP
ncbi:hypothetical protein G6F37_012803 [Rhizopus arrhizus]|nr:hypothetical protein G6F38_012778 [Rhizopus arrhizus]KAG1141499.1 hypothetical protein G6F37_012803 [Rhizopus arrhizus]